MPSNTVQLSLNKACLDTQLLTVHFECFAWQVMSTKDLHIEIDEYPDIKLVLDNCNAQGGKGTVCTTNRRLLPFKHLKVHLSDAIYYSP